MKPSKPRSTVTERKGVRHIRKALSLTAASAALFALLGAGPVPGTTCTPASGFVGTICAPDAPGKYGAVLVLGGSGGGDALAGVAARFSGMGYVAASIAYFGLPTLPPRLDRIPVETVGRALDTVAARPDVDAARIAVFGDSKGGELALLAATVYPRIHAVVAMVPSPFAWQARGGGSSWTVGGTEVPFVPNDIPFRGPIETSRQVFDTSLQRHRRSVDAAMFPLEKIQGPVLCLAADDDRVWNSPYQCSVAMDYLRAHSHAFPDEDVHYPNAGHTFLFATQERPLVEGRRGSAVVAYGGTPQGNVEAAAMAWATIERFLRQALR